MPNTGDHLAWPAASVRPAQRTGRKRPRALASAPRPRCRPSLLQPACAAADTRPPEPSAGIPVPASFSRPLSPIRRQWQAWHLHERRRDHVVGQLLADVLTQLCRIQSGGAVGDKVCHEAFVARHARATTTACFTSGRWSSTDSISPNSIRNPRILTWLSIRPRNSTTPSCR